MKALKGNPIARNGGNCGRLLYRSQFILGPDADGPDGWKGTGIGSGLRLYWHPDLDLHSISLGNKSIVLLGYILDPRKPLAGNRDILEDLMGAFGTCGELIKQTFEYGGRWIIIAGDGQGNTIFNDAAGLRQVFYSVTSSGVWCASQPGLLADILKAEMDPAAVDYVNSPGFKLNPEYRWPGYSSSYKEIKHLLPSHSLDLKTGARKRYWPDGRLDHVPLEKGLEKACSSLAGLMKSASERFNLALSMTSGLDSRVVLAASRDIRDKVEFMSLRQLDMPGNHADLIVPSRLIVRLGLKHETVKSRPYADPDFIRVFHKNVDFAHAVYANDAYAIMLRYRNDKVAVTGSVSEIARCLYRDQFKTFDRDEITAARLSGLQKMGDAEFAIAHFDEWLDGLADTYNLNILDIFEWEQGHGNWLAMCQLEFDTGWKDIFTPFNCRALLACMLSVPEEFRGPPDYKFFKKIILHFWPELLEAPINPHKKKKSLFSARSFLNNKIRKIHDFLCF